MIERIGLILIALLIGFVIGRAVGLKKGRAPYFEYTVGPTVSKGPKPGRKETEPKAQKEKEEWQSRFNPRTSRK